MDQQSILVFWIDFNFMDALTLASRTASVSETPPPPRPPATTV